MNEATVKKALWPDVLFVVGAVAIIAGVIWLLARCGLTC